MLPPDQRLEAADVLGSRVDDRLVGEPELLQTQGLRELDLERESLNRDVAQRRVEDRDATFSWDFALYIAMSASRRRDSAVLSWVAKVTPTLAGTARPTPLTSIGTLLMKTLEETLRERRDIRHRRDVLHETVNSSPPSRATVLPGRTQLLMRSATPRITWSAGAVSHAVVHGLEVVEVDDENRNSELALTHRPLDRVLEAVDEEGSVRQPGEPVLERAALELPLELVPACRVAHRHDDRADVLVLEQVAADAFQHPDLAVR